MRSRHAPYGSKTPHRLRMISVPLKICFFCLVGLLAACSTAVAQRDTTMVTIEGKVIDVAARTGFFNLMVANKRTNQGTFGYPNGTFTIRCAKSDTIMVGSLGYQTVSFTVKDSVPKARYRITLPIKKLSITLHEVQVFPERDLEEIEQDIQKLGYQKRDYTLSGIDAVQSPITFLYQQFSRRERKIREAHEMANEDRKRELLKELFRKYVHHDIIELDDTEFDTFIDFCNVSDAYMRNTSQYDFIIYIKTKYAMYRSLNDYRPDNR